MNCAHAKYLVGIGDASSTFVGLLMVDDSLIKPVCATRRMPAVEMRRVKTEYAIGGTCRRRAGSAGVLVGDGNY
jgi:hypothetical protein